MFEYELAILYTKFYNSFYKVLYIALFYGEQSGIQLKLSVNAYLKCLDLTLMVLRQSLERANKLMVLS